MDLFTNIINEANNVLWTYVLIIMLLGCAIWFSVKTRFVQFRMLGEMIRLLGDSTVKINGHEKHISSFQAFTISLASRVGTGNLAGVATALTVGGPGAIFWMWIAAFFGMATKYAEIVLGLLYREKTEEGMYQGGPMYYIAHTHMTHLYNAMNPIKHRAPGPIIAAADDEYCEAELICDNVHIHPAIVRNTFKMFGEDRVIFISDTMEAAGLEDGMYELGGQPVIVKGNRATLEDGTIAGSNTNLMKCMRTAVKQMGIPLEKAVRCAAVNPAKSIGIYDQYGSITPGKVANAVLLDQETLEIKGVILKGQML